MLVGQRAVEPFGELPRRVHQFIEGLALGFRAGQHREQIEPENRCESMMEGSKVPGCASAAALSTTRPFSSGR